MRDFDAAAAQASDTAPEELLVLTLGRLRLGLRLTDVERIVRAVAITPLPKAPPITEGVIDVGGCIVPVVDVRGRFGQPESAVHLDDHFVLARAGNRTIAFRADGAVRLALVQGDSLHDARFVTGAAHVAGIAALSEGVVVITDLAEFLSDAEERALDAALHASDAEVSRP